MSKMQRGFALLDKDQRREVSSQGGKAAHEKGTGHEWTLEEARAAGRKGGIASRGGRGKISETTAVSETTNSEAA